VFDLSSAGELPSDIIVPFNTTKEFSLKSYIDDEYNDETDGGVSVVLNSIASNTVKCIFTNLSSMSFYTDNPADIGKPIDVSIRLKDG
jgi:hypothetical protein